tara:strand:+ start:19761 stop:20417 length:657 start_codon:yes stop_codon:yes gene_type:complete
MINTSRLIFALSFLTCFSFSRFINAQSERFIREALQGKLTQKKEENISLKSKIHASSDFFKIDLNFDSFKDGILFKAGDHSQEILIYNAKKEMIKSFEMPYVGFRSSLLKYTLNKLGSGIYLVVLYYSEGRVSYLDKSSRVKTYLLTIRKDVSRENLFFQSGPVLMEEFISKRHGHLLKRSLDIVDLDGNGIKDLVVETSLGVKTVYVLGESLKWIRF